MVETETVELGSVSMAGSGLLATASVLLDISIEEGRVSAKHRLFCRLSFRDWSRGVDRDGLVGLRQWLAVVEDALNASPLRVDPL